MTYLQDHKPRQTQFRARRDKVSGLIVVHTAESNPDLKGPDTGVDGVASFIANRSDYGSYHTLADSDSTLRLVPFELAAYGDGTGSNEFAIHISLATQAHLWPTLPKEWRDNAVKQLAKAAFEAATWLKDERGIVVPARRVNRSESEARMAGFISHAERDPSRRSDPGAAFPWADFLNEYARLMFKPAVSTTPPAPANPPFKGKPGTEVTGIRQKLTQLIKKTKNAGRKDKLKEARKDLPSR